MQRLFVGVVLVFIFACHASLAQLADYQLALYPNNTTIVMGDSMTVSWAGNCSVEYLTGCYDWLSIFPAAACTSGAGANTCYLESQWVWVDNLPLEADTDKLNPYQHGSWSFNFLAPGQYQFRIMRCACKKCEPVLDDMLACGSYPMVTASPVITVKPKFANLNSLSESEQIVAGFLWWILTSNKVTNADGIIQALINAAATTKSGAVGGSCISDIEDVVTSFETAAKSFYQLYEDFSLQLLYDSFGDVLNALKDIVPTLNDCDVAQWAGPGFVQDVEDVINFLIPGLDEVEEIIQIAIKAEPIYIDTVNFFSSLKAEQYFASGVYFGRFVETVIPLLENAAK